MNDHCYKVLKIRVKIKVVTVYRHFLTFNERHLYYNFEEGQGYVAFQCRTTFYVCICGGKERIGGFRLKKKKS